MWIIYLGETLSIATVNMFVLISGYFMCRSNSRYIWKPIEMIMELK